MCKWLGVLLLNMCLLSLAPVKAQEFYESPYVILVETTLCTHSAGSYQTGFRVKEKPGIFTALHGVVACDSIYTFSGGYQRLIPIEVDVARDVIRLCPEKDLRTNNQTQEDECTSSSPEEGFTPTTETNLHLTNLKIVGHPAGSRGQYTIESIKAGKTSTDTLGSLVGPALVKKLETRQSPLPTIRVIPLEGALTAGLSGAPVLTADDQLVGIGDGSQGEGLSWLIPWSALQLIPVQEAQAQLEQLRNLKPDEFFLSSTTDQGEVSDNVIYRGVVKDTQNQPLLDAKVIVQLVDQTHRVYTKANGEFLVVLHATTANQQLPGVIRVEKDGYSTYEADIEALFQQQQQIEIRLDHLSRPLPTTFTKDMYVRVDALTGVKKYQSYTPDTPIDDLFAYNVILVLVDGPKQNITSTWWKVHQLGEKVENSVWVQVADGQMIYVKEIDKLGKDGCVATKGSKVVLKDEAGSSPNIPFTMLEADTLLRVMNSQLTEKDNALWVQVEQVNLPGKGWVEYAGTAGIRLKLVSCGSITPTATLGVTPTIQPITTVIPTITVTPTSTATVIPAAIAQLIVEAPNVNIRSGPGTVYEKIGGTQKGEKFSVTGHNLEKDWWQICCIEERQGWIRADLATVTNPDTVPLAKNIPEPPSEWINPRDGAKYIFVPAGEFIMGSNSEQIAKMLELCHTYRTGCMEGWFQDEKLQKIYLNGFWIMQTEVTNAMYTRCVATGACSKPDNDLWSNPVYANYPVTNVDWFQAKSYAEWSGGRLPTEEEWEKAARGTNGNIFPWGNEWDPLKANFENSGHNTTVPVDSYEAGASPYGLLQMAGNVSEWTNSRYEPTTEDMVYRGGFFHNQPLNLRTSEREDRNPSFTNRGLGLRVVRDTISN